MQDRNQQVGGDMVDVLHCFKHWLESPEIDLLRLESSRGTHAKPSCTAEHMRQSLSHRKGATLTLTSEPIDQTMFSPRRSSKS